MSTYADRLAALREQLKANSLDDFKDISHQPIVLPADMNTGGFVYPYAEAKKP